MRITEQERRHLNRRLKDRIPQVFRKKKFDLPALVLFVSATIWITPEALAQVQSKGAQAVFVEDKSGQENQSERFFTKTYTKEELSQKLPENPVIGLDKRIMTEITGLLNNMAAGFKDKKKRASLDKNKSAEPGADDYLLHVAALQDPPSNRDSNPDGVRSIMTSEAQRAASTSAKAKFTILDKVGSGFGFDLNLGDKKESHTAASSGQVRYGLIIKDIEPDIKAPKQASINDTMEDMKYAGRADVQYSIGPISEEKGRTLFYVPHQDNAGDPREETLLDRIRMPSPNFKGKVTPENFENFAKISQENTPVWRFDLAHEEDLYSMTYKSKTNGERISTEHLFKVPVAGTIQLGRRFSDNWDVVQTSAYNILYDKRLPLLSVHYMNIEQRYAADLTKKFGSSSVGVAARGKATGTVEKPEDARETYSLEFTQDL